MIGNIIMLCVLTIIGLVNFTINLILYKKHDQKVKELVFQTIFSIVSIVTGVSFLYANNYTQFGFTSTSILIFCAVLPFMFSKYIKTEKAHRITLGILSILPITLFIIKLTFNIPTYEKLPLNICNFVQVFIIIRLFYKNKVTDTYILTFGILGALANYLLGDWYSNKDQFLLYLNGEFFDNYVNNGIISFWNIRVFESNMIHNFYLIFCFYCLLKKEIIAKPKDALLNFLWITPVLVVLVFLNQINKFNFFFTSQYRNPIIGIYNLFPVFNVGEFEINLLYYLFLIIGSMSVLYTVVSLLKHFQKKIKTTVPISKYPIGMNLYYRVVQNVLYLASFILKWPKQEYFLSENSINVVPKIINENKAQNVLIVSDNMLVKIGLTTPLTTLLESNNIEYHLFTDVVPNPTINNILDGTNSYIENKCDSIIAFGGGSVIDCAKILGVKVTNNKPIPKLAGLFKVKHKIPLLLAIPTTSGSGSESTIAAVISDPSNHTKFSISDFKLVPKYAVLDPTLIINLPLYQTGITGIDALSHALEGYLGNSNTKQTKADSIEAFRLIMPNLKLLSNDLHNLELRNLIMEGSYLAGRAFTKSYVGYIHAISHALTAFYDIPHGASISLLIPVVLKYYGKKINRKLSSLYFAYSNSDVKFDSSLIINDFIQLLDLYKLPKKYECIQVSDYPKIINHVLKEANPFYPVPTILYEDDISIILDEIKNGI
jgi:alcohol dehydrogenase class IV